MREFANITITVALTALACASGVYGWDVEYNANTGLLPTSASPPWQLSLYSDPTPTISDGVLRIQHGGTGSQAKYIREGCEIAAGVPVTMEARMRVVETSIGAAGLSIQTRGAAAVLYVYSDRVTAVDYSGGGWLTLNGDFTAFRTVRIAYDGGNRMCAWVDGQSAFSWGSATSGQDGVNFGSYFGEGPSDSYWQSVAYSKEFLPIPEPSSLLALAAGIGGLGLGLLRRRRG